MQYLLVLVVLFLFGCSEVSPPPTPPAPGAVRARESAESPEEAFPSYFTVVFTREYGLWKFRACTLEISLFVNANTASLECQPTDGPSLDVHRELPAGHAGRLRELVRAADLYGPDHVGRDHTPTDGIFEALRFRPAGGGQSVVLVTSGNSSFVDHAPRRDLLQLLNQIESDLAKDAGLVTR